ncbi:late competence development ComFB family protein [Cellvibrio sp. PSBB006]|uniref:late competence development ComFB family protein n=1 Tax=Cellvibrio sp. PSBB006 TaxID=1987723 RepID=UPI000B3B6B0B|nr:late competence development ComFB family protein [Cellvibrio sp. PSBB006]ARU26019.1 hypothetical protein CBR65_00410 [Cellvibrio sp. PSBB006]
MLTTGNRHYTFDDDVDFIHNYYERLVLQEISATSERVQAGDREFLADVACVALNRLPPRYIRHDVDMTFFMSPQEMQEIEHKIKIAVQSAIAYVQASERGEEPSASKPDTASEKKSPRKSTGNKKPGAKKSTARKPKS